MTIRFCRGGCVQPGRKILLFPWVVHNSMKVLALASRFNVSGQGIAAHYLAHELARRGHKVRLRVFDSVPELKGQFKDAAYELDVRPSIAITASTGFQALKQVMDMLRLQKEKDFDVVLGLDSGEACVLGASFGKQAGLNVAMLAWGNELEGLGPTEKGVLRNCDLFMPVSRWAKSTLIEADFDEAFMKVLPPGVDHGLFSPPKDRPKELGIVTVTDLRKGCGVDTLVDVVKTLLDKGQDAFLSVIGTGPQAKAFKRKAKEAMLEDSIKFLGRVSHVKMPEVLRRHRVFALLPRRTQDAVMPDVCLAMMEAASCGLGIVGTELGGLTDTLRSCGGTKVPAEAPAKAADIIERVAGKLSIVVATEGEYGRSRSWAEAVEELDGVLEELIY